MKIMARDFAGSLFEHASKPNMNPTATTNARMGILPNAASTIQYRPRFRDRTPKPVSALRVETTATNDTTGDELFEAYRLRTISFPDAQPHPGELVESAALAGINVPMPDYRPWLPPYIVEEGIVSDVQLEAVTYIGEAHSKFIGVPAFDPTHGSIYSRQGFMLGDGAGAGKGRIIAATILDRRSQGDSVALWISQGDNLYKSTMRDLKVLGAEGSPVRKINEWKLGGEITMQEGVIFSTYASLRSRRRVLDENGIPKKDENGQAVYVRRIDQLVEYLGADFSGLVVFDESQSLARAREVDDGFGGTTCSLQGQIAVELQQRLPYARVIYSSATSLDRLDAVAYAPRLGLWGPTTQFETQAAFIKAMEHGRKTALEIVCRHLKAKGLYLARQMSYRGIETQNVVHAMTDDQHQQMRNFNVAWRAVTLGVEKALQSVGATDAPQAGGMIGATKASDYAESVRAKLESAKQRFYVQALTSMKLPTIVEMCKSRLAEGDSVVLQMHNTYEAYLDFALEAAAKEGITDPKLMDRSCIGELVRFVREDFPSKEITVRLGDDGETVEEFVVDPLTGVPIENAEAKSIRESVTKAISNLVPVENHLDVIQATFGEKFAEVTGRAKRVVTGYDGAMRIERRGTTANAREIEAFNNGHKRVLAFSRAGGVGEDYASNRTYLNNTPRSHMVIQIPDRAIDAEQGLGRTNRTNQKHQPRYAIVTTDYPCEIRMASPLARRMRDLGSLTKGDREAGSNAFGTAVDIEGPYASKALRIVLSRIASGSVPGVDAAEFYAQTGIDALSAANAYEPKKKRKPGLAIVRLSIKQFLNRLMTADAGTDGGIQGRVVDLLLETMSDLEQDDLVGGTADLGAEHVRAESLRIRQMMHLGQIAHRAYGVGMTHIVRTDREPRMTFGRASALLRNHRNFEPTDGLSDFYEDSNGSVSMQIYDPTTKTYSVSYPNDEPERREPHDPRSFTRLNPVFAEGRWKRAASATGELIEREICVIHGSLLNVWKDLETATARPKSVRLTTDDGKRLDGCILSASEADAFLASLRDNP